MADRDSSRRRPPILAGVDGCPAGWVVALSRPGQAGHEVVIHERFPEVLDAIGEDGVAVVDIPIGLLDEHQVGGRDCDIQARKTLGRPRGSSVFPAPIRAALMATDWKTAKEYHLSKQGAAILGKIREVDRIITPQLQQRVIEGHPEFAFCELAGAPMRHKKSKPRGRAERLAVLQERAGSGRCRHFVEIERVFAEERCRFTRRQVRLDDLIDAYVMLRVAVRFVAGRAARIPEHPPRDRRGLRMEMWA